VTLDECKVDDQPVIIVLGNEGSGIRTNILNRCDLVLRLGNPSLENIGTSSEDSNEDVDSLNVSVAGGIILNHFLGYRK
jgi:21S rRNA (GM2251-2'-O)-methyltransferase